MRGRTLLCRLGICQTVKRPGRVVSRTDVPDDSPGRDGDQYDPDEAQGRAGGGRFGQGFTDEEFLDAVRELNPARTTEVAEIVGCSRETARLRLEALLDADRVERRKVEMGEWTAWIWSVPSGDR